jgi:hypothetical protein
MMTTKRTSIRAQLAQRLRIQRKAGTARSLAGPDSSFWAHRYYTDGVKLYRFVSWVHRSLSGVLAEFEDCHTLDVLLVSIDSLGRSRLRPVVVAASGESRSTRRSGDPGPGLSLGSVGIAPR